MPLPKKLGTCVDRLYTLREERKTLQGKIDAIKEKETEIKEHLIANLDKQDAQGVAGKKAKASITKQTVATPKDWDKFYQYLHKTKSYALMQRRLNDKACRELWEDGKTIPGVEPFNVLKVNVRKV